MISNIDSLSWSKENEWNEKTKTMRGNFKQLLCTLWLLKYKATNNYPGTKELLKIVSSMAEFGSYMPFNKVSGWDVGVMVGQLSFLMEKIKENIIAKGKQEAWK